MPITDAHVERFAALFDGYSKAYGVYVIPSKGGSSEGKVKGKARTIRGVPTLELYRKHLEGGENDGLGIIMLRDDNTCTFGAIDYDNPDMQHAKAEDTVNKLGLPFVLCRSKSGGGHFYVFLSENVDAPVIRDRLTEWCATMGMAAKTETFPKQTSRGSADDTGNWINLPYYNAEATTRYAIISGKAATLDEFLDYAESHKWTAAEMDRPWTVNSDMFKDGPPCLSTLESQGGFQEGSKKNGMFNVMVFLKKRFPDDWESRADVYNAKMANIKSDELQEIVRSVKKKNYDYTCAIQPINAVCQRRVCTRREFGVGPTDIETSGFIVDAVTRVDPGNGDEPLWILEVGGKRIEITHAELHDRAAFNRAISARANVLPQYLSAARWNGMIGKWIAMANTVPMPEDASPTGQLWEHIEHYALETGDAKSRDEIFMGKPYREEGNVYFRGQDLFKYLDTRRVQYISKQKVHSLIKTKGGGSVFWNVRGKGVNMWFMPVPKEPEPEVQPDLQQEPF